jgi:hypothetical protein
MSNEIIPPAQVPPKPPPRPPWQAAPEAPPAVTPAVAKPVAPRASLAYAQMVLWRLVGAGLAITTLTAIVAIIHRLIVWGWP